jgi:hypothetical protein
VSSQWQILEMIVTEFVHIRPFQNFLTKEPKNIGREPEFSFIQRITSELEFNK